MNNWRISWTQMKWNFNNIFSVPSLLDIFKIYSTGRAPQHASLEHDILTVRNKFNVLFSKVIERIHSPLKTFFFRCFFQNRSFHITFLISSLFLLLLSSLNDSQYDGKVIAGGEAVSKQHLWELFTWYQRGARNWNSSSRRFRMPL